MIMASVMKELTWKMNRSQIFVMSPDQTFTTCKTKTMTKIFNLKTQLNLHIQLLSLFDSITFIIQEEMYCIVLRWIRM